MSGSNTFPIILAHGIARFDALSDQLFRVDDNDAADDLHYFRNIRTHLQSHGFVVRHSHVEWARGVDIRAATLKREVERVLSDCGAEKVHIIAHSMGGLDSRHMLFNNRDTDFHRKVASLTTLGTPHHGSPVADALLDGVNLAIAALNLPIEGARDLTTEACAEFNRRAEDWERACGVRFRTYAGAQRLPEVFTPLKAAWLLIHAREGDNDGLVSVASARWRDEYFAAPPLDADHLNLLGWWEPSEISHGVRPGELEARIKALYLSIATELAAAFPMGTAG
ncbi:MAG: hypothetical protein HY763_07010 [Planctomycetes bacterium]|nr:hypothetical protein [Planctomycetota bacterium]